VIDDLGTENEGSDGDSLVDSVEEIDEVEVGRNLSGVQP